MNIRYNKTYRLAYTYTGNIVQKIIKKFSKNLQNQKKAVPLHRN